MPWLEHGVNQRGHWKSQEEQGRAIINSVLLLELWSKHSRPMRQRGQVKAKSEVRDTFGAYSINS